MSKEVNTYIVAVSGGVDSVVLLDQLVGGRWHMVDGIWENNETNYKLQTTNYQFIVAHFDHGIREDSSEDRVFVEELAKKYGLEFEYQEAQLGPKASEEKAREERYNFLRCIRKKHNAFKIITAHHQDDLIETALINLLRGTSWRGLTSLVPGVDSDITRPLLNKTKAELLEYAKEHQLKWREDSTNTNNAYLRNYVRRKLIPKALSKDPEFTKKMLSLVNNTQTLKSEIDNEINNCLPSTIYRLLSTKVQLPTYDLIMWPDSVSKEMIHKILTTLDPNWHPTSLQLERTLHFIKSAKIRKTLQVSSRLEVYRASREVEFRFTPES